MYRPSVQAVPGAKVLRHHHRHHRHRHRLGAPMARRAVRNVPGALNARNVVSRHRSRSHPNAVSDRAGRHRRRSHHHRRRWTAAVSVSRAVSTTKHGG
ncbi:hypothetical protein [Amycolatopsis sp. NPDC051071]|uniref:hypothetical protein n=1 Tax=Amycolatopsis sp. NPDC051071 TaxID=3154637 RepID=UPI00341BE430